MRESFMTANRLPLTISIKENIGKADARQFFASLIGNTIQAVYDGGIFPKRHSHVFQMVQPWLAVYDSTDYMRAIMQLAIRIYVHELRREQALDCRRIALL